MLGKALQPVIILIDSEKNKTNKQKQQQQKTPLTLSSSAALLERISLSIHNPSLALFTTVFAFKAYAVYL